MAVSQTWVQPGEGPLNAGSNSDSLKVSRPCLSKIRLFAGKSGECHTTRSENSYLQSVPSGENVLAADNQQERLDPRWVSGFVDGLADESEGETAVSRILRDSTPEIAKVRLR